MSVYSVPEKKEHTDYALDTASKLLEFYNNFFDIEYPLKKLGEYTEALERNFIPLQLFFLFSSLYTPQTAPSLFCQTW